MKHPGAGLLVLVFAILSIPGCQAKKNPGQAAPRLESIASSDELPAASETSDPTSKAVIDNAQSPLPEVIRYGGAEEEKDKKIFELITEQGSLGNDSIRNLYLTKLSNDDRQFTLVRTHDNAYKESVSGFDVVVYQISDNIITKKYGSFEGSLPYYEWYDGLRYKSKIPGDWVECGFVGDFNGDELYELAAFSALGMGFFMEIYEYDQTTDSFIKTFEEELNLGYTEMVQYGEAKGTKGFFLNNDFTTPWNKKSFYGWDPDQRQYVHMATYLAGEEQ